MNIWQKPEKLNRLSIIDQVEVPHSLLQRQEKHLKNMKQIKSSFSSTFSHCKNYNKSRNKKYQANISYFGFPLTSGIKPNYQIDKENKKMHDRILTAKPSISNHTFSINSRDEEGYRKNILKTKCKSVIIWVKHPDYMREVEKYCWKGKGVTNMKKLYRFESQSIEKRWINKLAFNLFENYINFYAFRRGSL